MVVFEFAYLKTVIDQSILNIYNSYHILISAEQNSSEDGGFGSTGILTRGFDYDPEFGGHSGSNDQANYYFSTAETPQLLTASLVWNMDIDEGNSSAVFPGTATHYDLDLHLYDITQGEVLIASSDSIHEHSENIWLSLQPGRSYALRVTPGPGQNRFSQDYAIAWQIVPDTTTPVSRTVPLPALVQPLTLFIMMLPGIALIRHVRE